MIRTLDIKWTVCMQQVLTALTYCRAMYFEKSSPRGVFLLLSSQHQQSFKRDQCTTIPILIGLLRCHIFCALQTVGCEEFSPSCNQMMMMCVCGKENEHLPFPSFSAFWAKVDTNVACFRLCLLSKLLLGMNIWEWLLDGHLNFLST